MSGRIIRRQEAERDAIDAALYIAHDNADAGRRFLDAVEATYRKLAAMPLMGVAQPLDNPALDGLRRMAVHGFRN